MRQANKDVFRVAGHGQACYANHPILDAGLLSGYSVYKTRRTREEKAKKAKEQRLKDQGEEEAKEQKEAIMSMATRKQRLENREKSVSKEQKQFKERLAEELYDEANRRLQKTIVDKNIGQRSLLFTSQWR